MSTQKSDVEAPSTSDGMFGGKTFREVTKSKEALGWALIQYDWFLIRRGNLDTHPLGLHVC